MAEAVRKALYNIFGIIFRNREAALPLNINQIKKVLILRYDVIGDMIVTLPVIDFLHKHLPDAKIDLMVSDKNYDILKYDDRVNQLWVTNRKLLNMLSTAHKIQKNNYDLIFSLVLNKTTKGGLLANLAGVRKTVKVTLGHLERKKMYMKLFNVLVPPMGLRENNTMAELQVQMCCHVIGKEYNPDYVNMSLINNNTHRQYAESYLKNNSITNPIILNISSGKDYLKWDLQNFEELLELISSANSDEKIVLISAPFDSNNAEYLEKRFNPKVSYFRTKSIMDAAAIIERAKIVITPDTSIVHLTAAIGKPLLAFYLYDSKYYKEWMPFGTKYMAVFSDDGKPFNSIPPRLIFESFRRFREEIKI